MIQSATRSIKGTASAALLSLSLLSAPHTVAAQQSLELSLDQARVLAHRALADGQFEVARDFALALTEADANDLDALLILSISTFELGDYTQSRLAAARAWRQSDEEEQRYRIARIAARAASEDQRFLRAQLWLRTASLDAQTEQDVTQTRNDYRHVRNLNPLKLSFAVSASPSNNVNNGSSADCNDIEGITVYINFVAFCGALSPDAKALPGFVTTADLSFTRRITEHPDRRTQWGGRTSVRRVFLNGEAQDIAPDAENSDFGSTQAELFIAHDRIEEWGIVGAKLTAGQSWFGGAHNLSYGRVEAYVTTPLAERTALTVSGQLEERLNAFNDFNDVSVRGLSTSLAHQFESGARASVTLSYTQSYSDQTNNEATTQSARINWQPSGPVGPVSLNLSLGTSLSDYPTYAIPFAVPGGREDLSHFAALEMQLTDYQVWGFNPVVTVSGRETKSNIGRFDQSETAVQFSFRSSF